MAGVVGHGWVWFVCECGDQLVHVSLYHIVISLSLSLSLSLFLSLSFSLSLSLILSSDCSHDDCKVCVCPHCTSAIDNLVNTFTQWYDINIHIHVHVVHVCKNYTCTCMYTCICIFIIIMKL